MLLDRQRGAVRGLKRIDLRRDPPPDLVIEVDVTHSSVPRMPIYAALGVPEVWRLAEGAVSPSTCCNRTESYAAIPRQPGVCRR